MPFQQLWIVWGALFVSLFVYGAMPLVLPPPAPGTSPPQPIFVGTLAFLGLVTGIATIVVRRLGLIRPAREGTLDVRTREGAARFFTYSMLIWVLSEAVGVYGLVLFLMHRLPILLYPFLLAAALLLIIHAPRTSSLRPTSVDLARPDIKIG